MMIEIIRWVSIAILWACIGLQIWATVKHRYWYKQFRRCYEDEISSVKPWIEKCERLRCIARSMSDWVLLNDFDRHEEFLGSVGMTLEERFEIDPNFIAEIEDDEQEV